MGTTAKRKKKENPFLEEVGRFQKKRRGVYGGQKRDK